jgi:hypothetical protein
LPVEEKTSSIVACVKAGDTIIRYNHQEEGAFAVHYENRPGKFYGD